MLANVLYCVVLVLVVASPSYGFEHMDFSGNILLAHNEVDDFYVKQNQPSHGQFELRRAKLAMDGQINKQLSTEIEWNVSKEYKQQPQYEWADVNIQYKFNSNFSVKLGRLKMPFSLESQTSSAKLTTIERSLIYDAFMPARSLGGVLNYYDKNQGQGLALGWFNDKEDNIQGVTTRFTKLLTVKNEKLHLGLTLRHDDLNDQRFQIKLNGEINSADNIIRSARFYADKQTLAQTEVALISAHTFLQAQLIGSEVQQLGVDNVSGQTWQYGGFSLLAGHIIKGGNFHYKKGKFMQSLHRGAYVAVVRFSGIDLQDHNLGSKASSATLGVHYVLAKNLTLMTEVKSSQITGNTVNALNSGQAASFALRWVI